VKSAPFGSGLVHRIPTSSSGWVTLRVLLGMPVAGYAAVGRLVRNQRAQAVTPVLDLGWILVAG